MQGGYGVRRKTDPYGIYVAFSPDGLAWTRWSAHPPAFDSPIMHAFTSLKILCPGAPLLLAANLTPFVYSGTEEPAILGQSQSSGIDSPYADEVADGAAPMGATAYWPLPFGAGDVVDAYFDPASKLFVAQGKTNVISPDGHTGWKRGVVRATSPNFINWVRAARSPLPTCPPSHVACTRTAPHF